MAAPVLYATPSLPVDTEMQRQMQNRMRNRCQLSQSPVRSFTLEDDLPTSRRRPSAVAGYFSQVHRQSWLCCLRQQQVSGSFCRFLPFGVLTGGLTFSPLLAACAPLILFQDHAMCDSLTRLLKLHSTSLIQALPIFSSFQNGDASIALDRLFVLLLPETSLLCSPLLSASFNGNVFFNLLCLAHVWLSHGSSHNLTNKSQFKQGIDESAVAFGSYDDATHHSSGFGELKVETNSAFTDEQQYYAAGFLEGVFTAEGIYNHYMNLKSTMSVLDNGVPANLTNFLDAQYSWTRKQAASNSSSFWKQVP